MEYMGVAAFVFAIFGMMAWLQLSPLKKRITDLERELARMGGTSFNEERSALVDAAKAYVGRPVKLELREDFEDVDVVMYGNTKHGSNIILDADDEWLLVRVATPKGEKEKLLRLEAVARIGLQADDEK